MGAGSGVEPTQSFGGLVSEVVSYDRVLPEHERYNVESELIEKYLVTLQGGALDLKECRNGMGCGGYVPLMMTANDALSAITAEFWAYPRNLTHQHAVLTFGTNDMAIRFNGMRLCVSMFTATPGEQCFVGHYHTDTWHHVSVVINADLKSVTLYTQGELQGSLNFESMPPLQLYNMTIGGGQRNLYPAFDGLLTEVRLWNIAVPASAIKVRHGARITGQEDHLVGYWAFDADTTFHTLWDRSPYRHHAQVIGGQPNVLWAPLDVNSVDKRQCSHLKPEDTGDASTSFKSAVGPTSKAKETDELAARDILERKKKMVAGRRSRRTLRRLMR